MSYFYVNGNGVRLMLHIAFFIFLLEAAYLSLSDELTQISVNLAIDPGLPSRWSDPS